MKKKGAQEIGQQIKDLVDELVGLYSSRPLRKKTSKAVRSLTSRKGASGALSILVDEDFLDEPRDLPAIMTKLKEIGRYYPNTTVSMNLLNLTKRRTLSRFKDNKTKKWQYVLRR